MGKSGLGKTTVHPDTAETGPVGRRAAVRPHRPRLPLGVGAAIAVLMIAVAAGLGLIPNSARGEESGGSAESLGPTAAETKEFLESGKARSLVEEPQTDLHAARTMPHRGLERSEALELAEAVFEPEIEAAGGIYDAIEPERFLSDSAAVVPASSIPEESDQSSMGLGAKRPNVPVLLESALPLRTENATGAKEAVDLGLTHNEGELQAENPLVEVGLPEHLGEGISLSEPEVEVTIAGAPEDRVPTNAKGAFAFYPEVAKDTDLIVAPTPEGVETMTDIRSAEAPTQTTYEVSLPPGADLRTTEGGGAAVVEAGRPTVLIPAPSATDAAGNPVESGMTVSGDRITISIKSSLTTVFPVLVDPPFLVMENWRWTLEHMSMAAWTPQTTNSGAMDPWPYERWNPTWYPGLDLTSGVGGNAHWGDNANWEFWVPRYRADIAQYHEAPSTWIYQLFTEGVLFLPWGNTANYPALVIGLVNPQYGWNVSGVHYGGQGEMNSWSNQFWFTNEYEQPGDKGVDMNLVTYEEEDPAKLRDTYMADAYIYMVDNDAPRFTELRGPSHWLNTTREPIAYEVEDKGLGISWAQLTYNGQAWGSEQVGPCGMAEAPCPRVVTGAQMPILVGPVALPTGVDALTLTAYDAMAGYTSGHSASGIVRVKVDHTAPEATLSGTLTEQGSLGTRLPSYSLRVKASDGVSGAPQSGVKKVEVKVDGATVPMPEAAEWEPDCQTQNCPFAGEWTLNSSEYAAGPHEVQVIATDAVDNKTTRTLQIELRHPLPSLEVSGTVTEQSVVGRELPSYTLQVDASALTESSPPADLPTYLSSFGTSGTGAGQFSHPGDIALGKEGELFVVDTNDNRIERFTGGTGVFEKQFGTEGKGQLKRPTAIAVAANGGLWITDSGNRRVVEFTPEGVYMGQFGEPGTGAGQFAGSGPEGIAIDYHGNIWVSDTYGGRLEKFNEEGKFIRSVGTKGTGYEQLGQPTAVEVAPGGQVYVTDWEDDKVAEYGEAGAFIRQFGSQGDEPGQLQQPTGLAIDSRGDVWVGDQNNGRVEEFNQAGEYLGRFGTAGSGQGQFSLQYPIGITTDIVGDIWVTDPLDNRVEKWVSAGYTKPIGTSYVRAIGSPGSGNGQFSFPTDLTVAANGDLWVTDYNNDRIEKFNEGGVYLGQFGSIGTGNGQFDYPVAIAIDPNRRLWVADRGNNRIEEFSETGTFIRTVGSLGSGNGQFNYPSGIAVDGNGDVWVADTLNNRIEEFGETGVFIRAVGTEGTGAGRFHEPKGITTTPEGNVWVTDSANARLEEFSGTGAFLKSVGSPGDGAGRFSNPTDVKLDSAGHLWVADRGNHRVQELNSNGEFLGEFGSAGTGTGKFQAPYRLAFAHNGNILVADFEANHIAEWQRPAPHSQISTEITVDGRRVDAGEARCSAETCPLSRSWTLQASSFTSGDHVVAVKATDGLGNATTVSYSKIHTGDTTKPGLELGGELATAPEGWIEQEEGVYELHATATDAGYGVTSLVFSLDGEALASKTQSCPGGACSASISANLNAHELTAGAHPAAVVATDGIGNSTTRRWNVNVDPEGEISVEEEEATIEAVEETAGTPPQGPDSIIGPSESSSEPHVEGPQGGNIEITETDVPVSISQDPSEGTEFEIADQLLLSTDCSELGDDIDTGGGEAAEVELEESGSGATSSACTPEQEAEWRQKLEEEERVEEEEVAAGVKRIGMEPITMAPAVVSSSAGDMTPVNGSATLAPNTQTEVDTVFRPMADGGYSFEDIRSAAAPEHYAYELNLSDEQELVQISPQEVAMKYTDGGPVAFTITALAAHDAIGTTVPTHLAVTGQDVITLTIEHRGPSPAGGSFIYPVLGGTGWEGGYRTIGFEILEPPPPTVEEEEGGSVALDGEFVRVRASVFGPAVASSNDSSGGNLEARNPPHWFAFSECLKGPYKWMKEQIEGWSPSNPESATIVGNCARLIPGDHTWRGTAVRGWGHVNSSGWVWVNEHPANQLECKKWGEIGVAKVHCYVHPQKAVGAITVGGDFRTAIGSWYPRASVCLTVYGHLRSSKPHAEAQESIESTAGEGERCHWPAE